MKKMARRDPLISTHRRKALIALLAACTAFVAQAADLVEGLPAESKREGMERVEAIARKGPQGIRACVERLVEPGKGRDADVRRALHGLSLYACREGKEETRQMLEDVYIETLKSKAALPVKGFIVRQLQVMGTDRCVPALSRCLKKEDLQDTAVQALIAIGSQEALDALRRGARRSRKAKRTALLMALARLADEACEKLFLEASESGDRETRLVALYGLANSGTVAAEEAFLRSLSRDDSYERAKSLNSFSLWIRRLAEKGNEDQAVSVCKRILSVPGQDAPNIRSTFLTLLTELQGSGALEELLESLVSKDGDVVAVAARLLIGMPGKDVNEKLKQRLKGADSSTKAKILEIFAERGEGHVLPLVLASLEDQSLDVRLAAVRAATRLDPEKALPALFEVLDAGGKREVQAVRTAIEAVPGPQILAAVSDAIQKSGSPSRKVALLEILEARDAKADVGTVISRTKDPSPEVRTAAARALGKLAGESQVALLVDLLEDDSARKEAEKSLVSLCGRIPDKTAVSMQMIQAMKEAGTQAQCALLRILGKNGDAEALMAVKKALQREIPEIRDASLRSLAEWPNPTAAELLLSLIRTLEEEAHRILCIRGYIRLAGMTGDPSSRERLEMYRRAMALGTRPEEKKMVLGGLGDMVSRDALGDATKAIGREALSQEAISAALRISKSLHMIDRMAAKDALEAVLAASQDERIRGEAQGLLNGMEEYADYATAWMVSGPYSMEGRDCKGVFDEAFAPEKGETQGTDWKLMIVGGELHPMLLEIGNKLKGEDCAAYLKTRIRAANPQAAVLEIGTDDGVKVWFDGELVHQVNAKRACKMGEDKVSVKLGQEWRDLMLKVTQCERSWRACMRVVGPGGETIEGLQMTPPLP